jgi:hypothetical protein
MGPRHQETHCIPGRSSEVIISTHHAAQAIGLYGLWAGTLLVVRPLVRRLQILSRLI